MKFLYFLVFCCLAQQSLARGLYDYFDFNGDGEAVSTRPNRLFSFFGRLGNLSDDDDDDEVAPTNPPEQLLPSFPSALLFLDPNRLSTLAALPGNAIGRNANPNGEGRVLGALIALGALSSNRNRGGLGGGIIINTPLNLTNVNNNTSPQAAAAPTVTTVATAPAAAAAATRIIPYPIPPAEYYNRRSQGDSGSDQAQLQMRPVKIIRRRPLRRQNRNPYSGLSRVQYL